MFVDGKAIQLTETQSRVFDYVWTALCYAFGDDLVEDRSDLTTCMFVVRDRGRGYEVTPLERFAVDYSLMMFQDQFPGSILQHVDDEFRFSFPNLGYFDLAPPLHAVGSEPKPRPAKPVPDGGNGLAMAV